MTNAIAILLFIISSLLTGCVSVKVDSPGRKDLINPTQIVGPGERLFLVTYRNGTKSVREGDYDKIRQCFTFSGLVPGKYSIFNLAPGAYQDMCWDHEMVEIVGFFDHKTLSFWPKKFRNVLVHLVTGKVKLPDAILSNDRLTIVRIDKYTSTGEVDPFFRCFYNFPRIGQGEHRDRTFLLVPGKYRLAIFARHYNPAWKIGDGNYRNYGREAWRKDWLLEWRKEYTDMYSVSFEVPEWGSEEKPPILKLNINIAIEQATSSESTP